MKKKMIKIVVIIYFYLHTSPSYLSCSSNELLYKNKLKKLVKC